jgi:hypothetical protein
MTTRERGGLPRPQATDVLPLRRLSPPPCQSAGTHSEKPRSVMVVQLDTSARSAMAVHCVGVVGAALGAAALGVGFGADEHADTAMSIATAWTARLGDVICSSSVWDATCYSLDELTNIRVYPEGGVRWHRSFEVRIAKSGNPDRRGWPAFACGGRVK